MRRVWEYLRAFGSDWITLMSGIGSVVLAAAGTVWHVPPWIFWGMGAIFFVVASFRVWLNERKALEKTQEQLGKTTGVSVPSGLFAIQETEWKLGVRDEHGGFGWLDPTLSPKAGTILLQVMVSITAIPYKLVESIELELMGKRISSDWESALVDDVRQRYIYLTIPDWVNPGTHKARLIARDSEGERLSPDFEVNVPRQT